MVAVPERIEQLKQRPWIAHMIRAVERYLSRLGSQFAAATTYFSVLAIVPVMMVAFSITGFVLTVVQPGLVDDVADAVAEALGGADAAQGPGLAFHPEGGAAMRVPHGLPAALPRRP